MKHNKKKITLILCGTLISHYITYRALLLYSLTVVLYVLYNMTCVENVLWRPSCCRHNSIYVQKREKFSNWIRAHSKTKYECVTN